LPNDRVIPFFDAHGLHIDRVLTDHGTEYCGTQAQAPDARSRAANNRDHLA